ALARRPALQAIDDNDAPAMAGPEAGARDIERALSSLVEDQRTALLLVVLEGLTYREGAEVQGVPVGTVMSRLARARMPIKARLRGERPALRRIKEVEEEDDDRSKFTRDRGRASRLRRRRDCGRSPWRRRGVACLPSGRCRPRRPVAGAGRGGPRALPRGGPPTPPPPPSTRPTTPPP